MGMSLQQARQDGRELFRPREVAEMSGLSEAFVRRLIYSGQLPSVRIAGTIRLRFADVEHLVTEGIADGGDVGHGARP